MGGQKGFAREHQNGFLWDLKWTILNDALGGDFHREYLSIRLDPDVLVCPIPSTYVEMHSPVLEPAVLRYGDDVAMMWRVATSGYAWVWLNSLALGTRLASGLSRARPK